MPHAIKVVVKLVINGGYVKIEQKTRKKTKKLVLRNNSTEDGATKNVVDLMSLVPLAQPPMTCFTCLRARQGVCFTNSHLKYFFENCDYYQTKYASVH